MATEGLYFDRQDHELADMVRRFAAVRKGGATIPQWNAALHPHGIIEMTTSHSMRIAHALITLLDSLEAEDKTLRLQALNRLHTEVLHCSGSALRYNTSRVLIQLMKDLIRSSENEERLMLAHDFHTAARGVPRVVRALLQRYRLLEMPEAWNQQTFDHHVHDANTKGRKNPTHLVMDAWIKGIRFLTVIYYNRVPDDAVEELLQAARCMEMTVRIGIEFRTAHRGRFVDFVWSPLDCDDPERFRALLAQPRFAALMQDYAPVNVWRQEHTLALLDVWNARHAADAAARFDLPRLEPLDREAFHHFVGERLPMPVHLAEYILHCLREAGANSPTAKMDALNALGVGEVVELWLTPEANPEVLFPLKPHPSMPAIMQRGPKPLLEHLRELPRSQVILSLAGLSPADVLELLWLGQGGITHLELFNLRGWLHGHLEHMDEINRLQLAINEGSVPALKHVIQDIVAADARIAENADRQETFLLVQRNLRPFQRLYELSPLGTRIGTDSTSGADGTPGMGLAFISTLPARARRIAVRDTARDASHDLQERIRLPIRTKIYRTVRYHDDEHHAGSVVRLLRRVPGLSGLGFRKEREWGLEKITTQVCAEGNLIALGGVQGRAPERVRHVHDLPWLGRLRYLNARVANFWKILMGFLPAQWAFYQADSWWFLVWFGALIWFFVTGVRNVIQAVVSAGGLRRTLLLSWKHHVHWNRIADSLFYTGFSVLLLELWVRKWLLQDTFSITVADNAVLVYSAMAIFNGFYVALHNVVRGFPREAVVGNLFRSLFAIPVAFIFGEALFHIFAFTGAADPLTLVQTCAAITSKCASDTVAGLIEGLADRNQYLKQRRWDYSTKLRQIYANYEQQELLFARKNVESYLERPEELWRMVHGKNPEVAAEALVNMLDMQYFWYYQPQAQPSFRRCMHSLSDTERHIVQGMKNLLFLKKEISESIINGLLGNHFAPALAFYLANYENYLKTMDKPPFQTLPVAPHEPVRTL